MKLKIWKLGNDETETLRHILWKRDIYLNVISQVLDFVLYFGDFFQDKEEILRPKVVSLLVSTVLICVYVHLNDLKT